MTKRAPDHLDPNAFAGLSRRLARRAVSADGLGANLPPLRPGAVTVAEAAPYVAALASRNAARDQAASTAGIPLGERIGRANPHAKPIGCATPATSRWGARESRAD